VTSPGTRLLLPGKNGPPPWLWKRRMTESHHKYRQISVNIFGAPARRVSYKYEYVFTQIVSDVYMWW
jgi:hypothetical protein